MTKVEKSEYASAHARVYELRGSPQECEHCGTTTAKTYDWASKTKNYNDPQDYVRLCRACHNKFDGKGAGKCQECGKDLVLGRLQKYCSPKCRWDSWFRREVERRSLSQGPE